MTTKKRKAKAQVLPIDREPYRSRIRRATEMARDALAHYGEPTMTLEELRQAMAEALPDVSLSDWFIKDRNAGFQVPAFYVETSALFKRYHGEAGSDVVDELFDHASGEDRFLTSQLSVLEVTSGTLRLTAGGRLTPALAHSALSRLHYAVGRELSILPLDDRVVRGGLAAVETHRLRAGDAIHLATALATAPLVAPLHLVMVSSDAEVIHATTAAGLAVLDPAGPDALARLRGLRAS